MSILKFSDGTEFNTSGPLRAIEEYDGWYVIGQGYLIPVDSEEDAKARIKQLMPAISC
jgi:hypothetical protein